MSQLERLLDILELHGDSGSLRTLTEVVEAIRCPKATVHRILHTLQGRGYVSQDPKTSRYSAGVRCFELGSLWAQNLDIRALAARYLTELNADTEATVHLAVYENGDAIYVYKMESKLPVVAKSYVGRRCPATCVATDRVLLAFEPHAEIDTVLSGPLPTNTEDSITDRHELEQVLARVRQDGFGVNHGRYRDGVGGVAAPIRDHTGRVVAAVGLCLPEHRFGLERFDRLRDATVATAIKNSSALGGPGALVAHASPV